MESLEKSSNAIPHVIIDCQNGPEGEAIIWVTDKRFKFDNPNKVVSVSTYPI